MDQQVHYKTAELVKAAGSDVYSFVASDESEDGHGDVIVASGWDLKRYKRNPVVLFGHDHYTPVGYSTRTALEGKKLMSDIRLAKEGTSEFIDTLRKLVDQKIVRAVSVGFRITKDPVPIRDKEDHITGFKFDGTELLEISLVSVPANANALQVAKAWGTSERTMQRLFAPDATVQQAQVRKSIDLLKARRPGHLLR